MAYLPFSGHLTLNQISNNSVSHEQFLAYNQLNVKTILFQTIQFSINFFFLFTHS